MKYIQAKGDEFLRFLSPFNIVTFSPTCRTSPRRMSEYEKELYEIHKLKLVTPPPFNEILQVRVEAAPVLLDGTWVQQWEVLDLFQDFTDAEGTLVTKVSLETAAIAERAYKDKKEYLDTYEKAIDKLIDTQVKSLGYSGVNSIAKFFRPNSPFYAESMAIGNWVDACWAKSHQLLAIGEQMTTEELLSKMPKYVAP